MNNLEWQGPLRPDEKPPEEEIKNPEKQEAVENVEQELSPEVIEMIMEKVENIDENGLAYTAIDIHNKTGINYSRLGEILKNGILGWINHEVVKDLNLGQVEQNEIWAKGLREYSKRVKEYEKLQGQTRDSRYDPIKRKVAKLDFNINGRSYFSEKLKKIKEKYGYPEIMLSEYFLSYRDQVAILFDISSFKEVNNNSGEGDYSHMHKPFKKYYNNKTWKIGEKAETEFGFSVSPRIAPRFFKGLVVQLLDKYSESDPKIKDGIENYLKKEKAYLGGQEAAEEWWNKKSAQEKDELISKAIKSSSNIRQFVGVNSDNSDHSGDIKKISNMVQDIFANNPELMIPIYDVRGNLLWPKQMSYEEVKKFVAEREAKKKEKIDSETSSE